jgi:hypothetical protein
MPSCQALSPNCVFKPTAEEVARIIHTPSRGGGLTRRYTYKAAEVFLVHGAHSACSATWQAATGRLIAMADHQGTTYRFDPATSRSGSATC